MDNFFTSYDALASLKSRQVAATGTIRESRMCQCPLTPSRIFKKKPRGEFDYRADEQCIIVQWMDNRVVHVASNSLGPYPLSKAKRFSRQQRRRVEISRPHLIGEYNRRMGGVDLLDKFCGEYAPAVFGKKWTWPFFLNAISMLSVASWRLYCRVNNSKIEQLDFIRSIVMGICKVKSIANADVSSRMVMGSQPHLPEGSSQGRCLHCQKNCRIKCQACNVRLHLKCFQMYHNL